MSRHSSHIRVTPLLLAAVFACLLGIGFGAMMGFVVGRVGFKRIALL